MNTVSVAPRVVFVTQAEILDTPGVSEALASTPIVWTTALRKMLGRKGLNVDPGSQIYDMMVLASPVLPPGWMFCNAGDGREAYGLFRASLDEHGEGWTRPYMPGDAVERDIRV